MTGWPQRLAILEGLRGSLPHFDKVGPTSLYRAALAHIQLNIKVPKGPSRVD
jgi:hypothetical protein